jgi:hypothetical protein
LYHLRLMYHCGRYNFLHFPCINCHVALKYHTEKLQSMFPQGVNDEPDHDMLRPWDDEEGFYVSILALHSKISTWVFLESCDLWWEEYYPGSPQSKSRWKHMEHIRNTFTFFETAKLFYKTTISFYNPISNVWIFQLLHILTCIILFFF